MRRQVRPEAQQSRWAHRKISGHVFIARAFVRQVFRTNSSYARWEEARRTWGGVVNRSRDLLRQVSGTMHDLNNVAFEGSCTSFMYIRNSLLSRSLLVFLFNSWEARRMWNSHGEA